MIFLRHILSVHGTEALETVTSVYEASTKIGSAPAPTHPSCKIPFKLPQFFNLVNLENIEGEKLPCRICLIVFQICSHFCSVSDPYNFDSDTDPGPWIRIRDDGSGSEVTFDSENRIFPIKCYARL